MVAPSSAAAAESGAEPGASGPVEAPRPPRRGLVLAAVATACTLLALVSALDSQHVEPAGRRRQSGARGRRGKGTPLADSLKPSSAYLDAQGCRGDGYDDCWRQEGSRLRQPSVIRGRRGKVEATLIITDKFIRLPGNVVREDGTWGTGTVGFWGWAYNGQVPGPTIYVKPGDWLVLKVVNQLGVDKNDWADYPDYWGRPNQTNIHVHGLWVSPQKPADNILVSIDPGQSYTYRYKLPENHPSGTYWYHPHRHQAVGLQTNGGLGGAIVVEDVKPQPPLREMIDRLLFVQNFQGFFAHDMADFSQMVTGPTPPWPGGFYKYFRALGKRQRLDWNDPWQQGLMLANTVGNATVNGQANPTISMRPGEWQRWRVLNAGMGESTLALAINGTSDPTKLGCHVRMIARDGVYLRSPREYKSEYGLIAGGVRVDYLVMCERPGVYALQSNCTIVDQLTADLGYEIKFYTRPLATMAVEGEPVKSNSPRPPAKLPAAGVYAQQSLLERETDGQYEVVFNTSGTPGLAKRLHRRFVPGRNKIIDMGVNGAQFNEDAPFEPWPHPGWERLPEPPPVRLGEVQEWNISNVDMAAPHSFHVHTWHFQIVDFHIPDGDGHPFDYAQLRESPHLFKEMWFDTVMVARRNPKTNDHGWVLIRLHAEAFNGTLVYHCHVLPHEDLGMMEVAHIVGEQPAKYQLGHDSSAPDPAPASLSMHRLR